jgi:hypothetical protein
VLNSQLVHALVLFTCLHALGDAGLHLGSAQRRDRLGRHASRREFVQQARDDRGDLSGRLLGGES